MLLFVTASPCKPLLRSLLAPISWVFHLIVSYKLQTELSSKMSSKKTQPGILSLKKLNHCNFRGSVMLGLNRWVDPGQCARGLASPTPNSFFRTPCLSMFSGSWWGNDSTCFRTNKRFLKWMLLRGVGVKGVHLAWVIEEVKWKDHCNGASQPLRKTVSVWIFGILEDFAQCLLIIRTVIKLYFEL